MTERVQLRTFGAHIDGMHLFPFPAVGSAGLANTRGLLVTNHEYVDPALVNNITPASAYATASLTLDMVRAQQAAHGISVVEVWKKNSGWEVKRPLNFTFVNGMTAAGDFLNSFDGGSILISVLDNKQRVIESYTVEVDTPDDSLNSGIFFAITRPAADIRSLSLSGQGSVADEVTFTSPVPEPEVYAHAAVRTGPDGLDGSPPP
jgi:hypothetical protein